MMDASALSKAIRDKKKKIAEADPEIVDTSPVPDMNAQDVWNAEKDGYVEDMLDSPKRINADETMIDEPEDEEIKKMDMARMGRLRSYFDKMSI